GQRGSGHEPRDSLATKDGGRLVGIEAERENQIRTNFPEGEACGHDTNHFSRSGADRHDAPDDSRIATKPALPIPVTQNHGFRRAWPIVGVRKPSAYDGLNAESRQNASRHLQRAQAFRTPQLRNRRLASTEQTEFPERSAVLRARHE